MNWKFLFYFFISLCTLVLPVTIKEKFEKGGVIGSYIVTENKQNISFLRFHSYCPPFLFLEEISGPSKLIKKEAKSWDVWLKDKAPHHTSWVIYKINLNSYKIACCYSFSRESFIALSEENSFLPMLLALPLEKLSPSERKKIGPAPIEDMPDTRKIWNPIKIFNGEKIKNASFEMMRAKWPKDSSELSNKLIDLYFDAENSTFPFPYWIEIGDGYNTFKTHVIDSGISLYFPFKKIPKKSPIVQSHLFSKESGLKIELKEASDFQSFQIIATTKSKTSTYCSQILPYEQTKTEDSLFLIIPLETLSHLLKANERYTLTIIPVDDPSLAIEITQPFYFNS